MLAAQNCHVYVLLVFKFGVIGGEVSIEVATRPDAALLNIMQLSIYLGFAHTRRLPGDAGKWLPKCLCNHRVGPQSELTYRSDSKHLIYSSQHLNSIEMPLQNFVRPDTGFAPATPGGEIVAFARSPTAPAELQSSVIVVDERDHEGVHIAARNLAEDFAQVTKVPSRPIIRSNDAHIDVPGSVAIVVGSVDSSPLVQRLGSNGKVDFSGIRGKWESFQTSLVQDPFDGCSWALVIAGSDKRGTIYGAYTLSKQIGVSP